MSKYTSNLGFLEAMLPNFGGKSERLVLDLGEGPISFLKVHPHLLTFGASKVTSGAFLTAEMRLHGVAYL